MCTQTEEDNQRRAAEVKKAEKRRAIAKMRDELRQLMDENEAQPPERKITADEFVIDREYSALLEHKGQELFEVRRAGKMMKRGDLWHAAFRSLEDHARCFSTA